MFYSTKIEFRSKTCLSMLTNNNCSLMTETVHYPILIFPFPSHSSVWPEAAVTDYPNELIATEQQLPH